MHFTYADVLNRTALFQGDVLRRTAEVDAILRDVHPHYTKDDYYYLIVLTQSCDLVRRYSGGTRCAARYISLAAVRPFRLVLSREIEKFQRHQLERDHKLCDATHREKIQQFVHRILNNNEEEYFYLHPSIHPEMASGIDEPMCAFLALSIAVKSEMHYDKCLTAKVLQLDESFQHKLGWLTGKMYSRVGTADWVPTVSTEDEFKKFIASIVGEACAWIDPAIQNKFFKQLKTIPEHERTPERVLSEYEQLRTNAPRKKEMLVERLGEILAEQGIDERLMKRIKNLVISDSDIAALVAK